MEMATLHAQFKEKFGMCLSPILIPNKQTDYEKWAVVACDQYTSQPEYWQDVEAMVGDSPSTLRLIYPEAFLDHENQEQKEQRIAAINGSMSKYLESNLFEELQDTVLLVERILHNGQKRHGLMVSLDLEHYSYEKGSQSLIRATEGTILDRLPPRIKIREHAPLELPHIMVLIDDRNHEVIKPFVDQASSLEPAYSTRLMKDSGSIKAYKINKQKDLSRLFNAMGNLSDPELFKKKYGLKELQSIFLFAVGDGNHSLATAKACWENIKGSLSAEEQKSHPARYALVEVVNLHDESLVFEPIHRILFNVDARKLLDNFIEFYAQQGLKAYLSPAAVASSEQHPVHCISYIHEDGKGFLVLEDPCYHLDVKTLQVFLDETIKATPSAAVDYVHGDEIVNRLGAQKNNIGFFLSAMDKNELFKTVILDGVLPRKTFSMGEAGDKRFYLETRRISQKA